MRAPPSAPAEDPPRYQGEQNTHNQSTADDYACLFPATISAWRSSFQQDDLYFGFVQLSTWCVDGIPEMREAQMAALALDNVGYATVRAVWCVTAPLVGWRSTGP